MPVQPAFLRRRPEEVKILIDKSGMKQAIAKFRHSY
jgi:hypothetical protein